MPNNHWHVEAIRLAAMYPYKTWSEVCGMVAKRKPKKKPPVVSQYQFPRIQQLRLFPQ
jgi:hypothetical protein